MNPISAQNVVKTYRRYAPVYDFLFGAVLEPGRRFLTKSVSNLMPDTLLEVGVGTGLTLFSYPESTRVVGVDLSDAMLERARHKKRRLPARDITLQAMDAENMSFPDASFDCVTVPYVLSVTPDPLRLIAELRRVCKPNGTIIILNHFSGNRAWWLLEQMVKPIAAKVGFRSDFHLSEHVYAHNWRVESIRSVNLFGLSKLITIRNV